MSHPVVLRPSAAEDVAAAYACYSPHGKADDFMAAVDRAIAHIGERPHMYPVVHAEVRRASSAIPYSVFFITEADHAVVLAVHHQRREPVSRPRP